MEFAMGLGYSIFLKGVVSRERGKTEFLTATASSISIQIIVISMVYGR
jgi:hypothetical protein